MKAISFLFFSLNCPLPISRTSVGSHRAKLQEAILAPHSDKICNWRKSQWRTNGFSSVHHDVCSVLLSGHPNVMKPHAERVKSAINSRRTCEPKKHLLLGLQHLFCLLSLWAVQGEFKSRCLYTSR